MSCATQIGGLLHCNTITEACTPPELVEYLQDGDIQTTRTAPSFTAGIQGSNRIYQSKLQCPSTYGALGTAALSHIISCVWCNDFYVVRLILYQLLTGSPLLNYSSSTEKLQQYDKDSLSVWKEPSTSKLKMVLSDAPVSPIRRLLARDLVCCCLEGDAKDRIDTMQQVLPCCTAFTIMVLTLC